MMVNIVNLYFSADIVFVVKDKQHAVFQRDKDNIVYTAKVPLVDVRVLLCILLYITMLYFD